MNARFSTALVLLSACVTASVSAAPASKLLIVPGRSIGQTALGPNGVAELKRFPKPDAEDNGMSQQRMVWVSRTHGRTDTLFIHTTRNGALDVHPLSGETIDTIRVTSRQFHTRNGISTGSTLAQIRRRFLAMPQASATTGFYVVPRRGISFEFAVPVTPASRCIAISVYQPNGAYSSAKTDQSEVDNLLKDSH